MNTNTIMVLQVAAALAVATSPGNTHKQLVISEFGLNINRKLFKNEKDLVGVPVDS